jgi:hypothetical protein
MIVVDDDRVVAITEAVCAELFPARSYAETVYVYEVKGERPVLEYEVPATVAIWVPPRYMRYPVTPTASILAVQERLI